MKLDSKYFDSIRVSRGGGRSRSAAQSAAAPTCQWGDCPKRGLHKAPKGRGAEGEYFHFCRDHVSEYNKAYNYFSGMNESEVTEFQKSAATGHRPTWSMGVHGADQTSWDALKSGANGDPLEILKALRGKIKEPIKDP